MIQVKFFKLKYRDDFGGPGEAAEITIPSDDWAEAFKAACDAGGDPTRKMLYRTVNQ